MQEAIIFTIFLVGGWLGLILLHAAGKIANKIGGFFIDKYKNLEVEKENAEERYRILKLREDKHLAEIQELKKQVLFYRNEFEKFPNE